MLHHNQKVRLYSLLLLLLALPQSLFAYEEVPPGRPPQALFRPAAPSEHSALDALSLVIQEFGQISLSMDAAGTLADSTTIQVEKANNATVRKALLMAATTGFTNYQLGSGDVRLEGNPIAWATELPTSIKSYNYWADVTSIVKPIVDSAPAGIVDLALSEANSENIDGELLIVVLDDPNQLTDNTILLYFGAQNVDGDNFTIEFAAPVDKTDPNFRLDLSLGISYGYQAAATTEQFSLIDVNGQRLTSSAGGQDDGEQENGGLITVGGIGDARANPADPLGGPTDPRTDDELYDLRDFVKQNDTTIQIDTLNPSDDDNILFAGVFLGATRSIGAIDVDISLYNNPSTATERAPYEAIIRYFADGLYEASNGANKLGRVTFYTNGSRANEADVVWVDSCYPNANISGYGTDGLHVNMCDSFTSGAGSTDYDFLADDTTQRGGGYTLAHEFGHYYYSLYDEYQGAAADTEPIAVPRASDKGVVDSIMHSQWSALEGNYRWLNFSIAKNNTQANAQHRVYGASGWETLVRPVTDDPRDGNRVALPLRLYHEELLDVQPEPNQDATIELPGDARSGLRILWISDTVVSSAHAVQGGGFPISAQLTSVLGQNIAYPNPILLMAFVHKDLMVTDLGIAATVTLPDGSQQALLFADDGLPPDAKGRDGIYSAVVAAASNGLYAFAVDWNNSANTAQYVATSFTTPLGANGQPVPNLEPTLVNEPFQLAKSLQVVVSNVVADDHANTFIDATDLSSSNHPMAGRIDRAGDLDMFRFGALSGASTYVRITNLALGMAPRLQIFTEDGRTVADVADEGEGADYLVVRLGRERGGSTYFAVVSDQNSGSTGGLYEISAGSQVPSDPALPPAAIAISALPDRLVGDGVSQSVIQATLQDENGNALPNQVVQWSSTMGSLKLISSTTNLTGSTSVVLTAPTVLGVAEVTATAGGIAATVSVTIEAGAPSTLSLAAAPVQIHADGLSTSTLTVTLADAFGHRLPGKEVTFTSSLGTVTPLVVTDANGTATALLTAGTVSGFAQIVAASADASATVTVELQESVTGGAIVNIYLPLIQQSNGISGVDK